MEQLLKMLPIVTNKLLELAREIASQKVKLANWLLLVAYDKVLQRREELKKILFVN